MTSRQTAAICATILLAACANLAGGFAIQLYFANRHPVASGQVLTGSRPLEPRLGLDAELPGLSSLGGDETPNLVPLPAPLDKEVDLPPLIGDGVGQPADSRVGRRFSPREFPDPDSAAPIKPRPLLNERVMAGIIEAELPEASPAEREVWMKQLQGLGPGEIRNLLQMRRRFGSDLSQPLEMPGPFLLPPRSDPPAVSLPVAAPVPDDVLDAAE